MAILLQSTNDIMGLAAVTTNPSVCMNDLKKLKALKTPHQVRLAKRRLDNKHRLMLKRGTPRSQVQLKIARKQYRQAVRNWRLSQALKRDARLDSILSNNPKQIYSYLRSTTVRLFILKEAPTSAKLSLTNTYIYTAQLDALFTFVDYIYTL